MAEEVCLLLIVGLYGHAFRHEKRAAIAGCVCGPAQTVNPCGDEVAGLQFSVRLEAKRAGACRTHVSYDGDGACPGKPDQALVAPLPKPQSVSPPRVTTLEAFNWNGPHGPTQARLGTLPAPRARKEAPQAVSERSPRMTSTRP